MELPLTQHPEAGPDRRLVPRAAVGTRLKEHSGRYRTWALASYLLAAGVKWTSSMRLHRDLGITQKTAWFLGHRIRECFRMDEPERFDGPGPVEVDEAYIGGKDRNKHAKKKHRDRELGIGKVIVAAARDRPSNRISAAVVGGTARFILTPFVKNRAGPDTLVVTDELASYAKLPYHLSVNHSAGQYVDGMAHTNGVESFWALLKRGARGRWLGRCYGSERWPRGGPDGMLTITGTYDLDLETLTAVLSDMTISRTPADGGEPSTEAFLPDISPYQFAFAATDSPTTILVSSPHLDQGAPYGDYRDWYYIATP